MQRDRELENSLRMLNSSPAAAAFALNLSGSSPPRVHDPTVRRWFASNGVPMDALGTLEM
jgi:hypothetical protein